MTSNLYYSTKNTPDLDYPETPTSSRNVYIKDPVYYYDDVTVDYDKKAVHWNERFQMLLDAMDQSLESSNAGYLNELLNLAKDFINVAHMYGKIIICERFLPVEAQTIPPVQVGGIAGGTKYIKQGILFKFVVDSHGIYGSDAVAMKSGGHELKGLIAYRQADIKGLHLPLMAIIDYRGFRVVAMSLLPISKKTLVYGSSDGGKNIYKTDEKVNSLMESAGKIINIKEHKVELQNIELCAPCDIEVHRGFDDRIYVLDFARVFPPEAHSKNSPLQCYFQSDQETTNIAGVYMTKLLRPEFVRRYKTPLSSDVFMKFGSQDSAVHDQEVIEATSYLHTKLLDSFAKKLNSISLYEGDNKYRNGEHDYISIDEQHNPYGYVDFAKIQVEYELKYKTIEKVEKTLILDLHREGINVRMLGALRQRVISKKIKELLLIEMLSRVIKNILRKKWREYMKKFPTPSEEPCKLVAVKYLNLVFGKSERASIYWEFTLKQLLNEQFPGALVPEEFSVSNQFRTTDLLIFLFQRVQKILNIQLTPPTMQFSQSALWYERAQPLDQMDIVTIKEVIKADNIVPYVEGKLLRNFANTLTNTEHLKWTLLSASNKFEESLERSPGGRKELFALAECYHQVALLEENVAKAISVLEMAQSILEYLSKEVDSKSPSYERDTEVFLLLAHVLSAQGAHKHNIKILERALTQYESLCKHRLKQVDEYYYRYANLCYVTANHYSGRDVSQSRIKELKERAVELAKEATIANPKNSQMWLQYAKFNFECNSLTTLSFLKTDDALLRAHTLDHNNPDILYLWGELWLTRAKQVGEDGLILWAALKFMDATAIKVSDVKLNLLVDCTRLLNERAEKLSGDPSQEDTKKEMNRYATYFLNLAKKSDLSYEALAHTQRISQDELKEIDTGELDSRTHATFKKASYKNQAVVIMTLKDTASDIQKKRFQNEIKYFSRLTLHPNIIKWYGVTENLSHVFEFCHNLDLAHYLAKNQFYNNPTYPWDFVLKVAYQLADALLHCHNQNVIHNDINSRHVLLDDQLNPRLKGFELALLETDTATLTSLLPTHTAPEVLKTGKCSKKSDVYTFGILMWELGDGGKSKPFDSYLPLLELVDKIVSGTKPKMPENWPSGYRGLINLCLMSDPQSRPDMAAVKREIEHIRQELVQPMHTSKKKLKLAQLGQSLGDLRRGNEKITVEVSGKANKPLSHRGASSEDSQAPSASALSGQNQN